MKNRTILLIGNKGLIGSYLFKYFSKQKKTKLLTIDKKDNIDIKNKPKLEEYLKKNKDINYIVNSSGKNDHIIKDQRENSIEDDKTLFEYLNENLVGPKNLIELSSFLCPKIKSIINFSSLYGLKSPYHNIYRRKKSLSYCVSKHALEGLTKYYATLLAKKNIRINNIRIGGIENNQPKSFVKNFLKRTPANKMAKKENLANVVNFLCSENSEYIIGENISFDGGYTLW